MTTSYIKSPALVLSTVDYSESDRIVSLFTERFGKLSAIAKGARRTKKRFVGKLDVPVLIDAVISVPKGSSTIGRLTEAALMESYSGIKSDVKGYGKACYVTELISEATKEGQYIRDLFPLVIGTLKELDNCGDKKLRHMLLRFYEIKALRLLGYLPSLVGCVECGSAAEDGKRKFFSIERGGIVCLNCEDAHADTVGIRAEVAGFLSLGERMPIDKLKRLKVDGSIARECEGLLYGFIRHHIGRELKSKVFLEKLKAIEKYEPRARAV